MYGKLKNYSIIKVKWSNGGVKWYPQKEAFINPIVKRFSNTPGFKYLQIYNYHKGNVGNKVFYYTNTGSYGYS